MCDVSHIYQAGAHVLLLRVAQGSAVITMETENSESTTTLLCILDPPPLYSCDGVSISHIHTCTHAHPHTHTATSQLLNHLYFHLSPEQKQLKKQSVFSQRTEEASEKQYFHFYGYLSQQQFMLQVYTLLWHGSWPVSVECQSSQEGLTHIQLSASHPRG